MFSFVLQFGTKLKKGLDRCLFTYYHARPRMRRSLFVRMSVAPHSYDFLTGPTVRLRRVSVRLKQVQGGFSHVPIW
jgi:hypothetical protein